MKITADTILSVLKEAVEGNKRIPQDRWLSAAFSLNTLLLDEVEKLENIRLELNKYKIGVLELQEKKNVSYAELVASTQDIYKDLRIQEAKVEQIKEFIRIAKKNSEQL